MTKQQKLDILMLLSALESWGHSNNAQFPDYLHCRLTTTMGLLSEEVLQGG